MVALRGLAIATLAASAMALAMPAQAQTAGSGAGQPSSAAPALQSNAAASMSEAIAGFRSAKFGDGEAAVRAAMVKDLKIKAGAILMVESSTEKTRALVARAKGVIPVEGSGTAEASYVLGHQSGKLIQVSLAWSKDTDPALTPDQLVANAALLIQYFRAKSTPPAGDPGLVPLVDGRFLLFRGDDKQKHTVMLIAHGPLHSNADGSRSVVIDALWLYYVENLDAPDAFRLPAGSF
jgi:hypothetical protein